MANGRMITKDICGDKRINLLSSDTSRLAFTWLVPFCDREGRTHGDPAMVRSMLFPRRQDVSIEQMESIIIEWACLGLIVWYEANGDLWIWFPGFDKNQPGLRKDKEAPSKIPVPNEEGTELVRKRYGISTDKVPLKGKEENGIEGKRMDAPPPSTPPAEEPQSPFDCLQAVLEGKGVLASGAEDVKYINDLITSGVIPEDLRQGIDWRVEHNDGKAVVRVSQVVGPAKTARAKRLQENRNGNGKAKPAVPTEAEEAAKAAAMREKIRAAKAAKASENG